MKNLLRLNYVAALLLILFSNVGHSQHTHIETGGEALRLDGANNYMSFFNGSSFNGYIFHDGIDMWLWNIGTGYMNFGTNSSQTMRLQSSGNLSLGTTNEDARLDVHGASDVTLPVINSMVTYDGNSDIIAVRGTSLPSTDYYGIGGSFIGGYRGVTGTIPSSITTGFTTTAVRGVNSSSTGTKYGVYGSSASADNSWAGYFDGNLYYSGTFTSTSDERLKKNVETVQNAMSKIVQITPVTYEYKTTEFNKLNLAKGTQIGFTAQDLEKVYPELVSEDVHSFSSNTDDSQEKSENSMTIKSVNYIGMIPILTKGIQEQQELISSLLEKVEQLEIEIQNIKNN